MRLPRLDAPFATPVVAPVAAPVAVVITTGAAVVLAVLLASGGAVADVGSEHAASTGSALDGDSGPVASTGSTVEADPGGGGPVPYPPAIGDSRANATLVEAYPNPVARGDPGSS